jgi:hypothetical protein
MRPSTTHFVFCWGYFMVIIQWIFAAPLFLVFFLLTLTGYWYLLTKLIGRKPPFSPTYFLGGIAGMLAIFIAPIDGLKPYWWLPMLLDLFALPYLFITSAFWIFLTIHINRKKSELDPIIELIPTTDEYIPRPKKRKKK